jgi:hypothetical protein
MDLIADRFVRRRPGETIDLATNRPVVIRRLSAGSRSSQVAWSARCAEFATFRAPRTAALVEYGLIGSSRLFEAWSASSDAVPVSGAPKGSATLGVRLQPRRIIRQICAVLEESRTGIHRIAIAGPPGSGLASAVILLA